jgi:hypothetical protein
MAKIAGVAPEPGDVVRYPDSAAQHKALFIGGITEWLAQQLRPGTQLAGNVQ